MPRKNSVKSGPVTTPASAGRGVVDEGALRCGPVRALPEVLDGLGADTDALLSEVGLTRSYLDDPENTVTLLGLGRLLRRSVQATGCDHLGVLVGRPITLSSIGAVGILMQASPNVAHALQVMDRHLQVHDRGAQFSVGIEGATVEMRYRITVPDVEAIEQLYMVAALAGHRLVRGLCGPSWHPTAVHLPFRRPRNVDPLREALAAPLKFESAQLKVILRASDLTRALTTADPLLYRMMAERIEQLEARQRRDLVGRVRDILQTLILLEDSRSSIVAGRMGMSVRTLNRRLLGEGTSLQAIRDAVCAEAACQLLGNTEKSASDVASLLGYSDSSAFTRAFRRWLGVPPAHWRARQRKARRLPPPPMP